MRRILPAAAFVFLLSLALAACGGDDEPSGSPPPNILFIVMDDVGIDQMQVFGYGGETPPGTPNIDRLAAGGVRFHNAWSMPACTTSRAVFFDGRYPVRTNVYAALGPNDLANSQVNPYETTAPRLLAQRGYQSGLFGKFHLGLQENNPAQYGMPRALGWDYFAGWLDYTGDPSSIDTTAGGVAPSGPWSCGFVPGSSVPGGADSGACYMADGSCSELAVTDSIPPGRICRDRGGILDPGATCQDEPPANVDFGILSAHYVSPFVVNREDGGIEVSQPTDPRARRFRARVAVDEAIAWINGRPASQPWMASVTFASAHTPVMQPPHDQQIAGNAASSDLDCTEVEAQRVLTNLMIESMDLEIGRLLVETGVATRGDDGRLVYDPEQSDTMVILIGDNGSLGSTVKAPFQVSRAKGTAYQTGVWVPMIVAGPLVESPGRVVSHMVNIADLFQLFGEIAGIDAHEAVPRPIDSFAMLPYLTDPDQPSIRSWNFTEVGPNLQANGGNNGPCLISSTCTQIPVSKSVCEDNNGVWYGAMSDVAGVPPEGLARCCNVLAFLVENDQPIDGLNIAPDYSSAVRNDVYKIVQNVTYAYQSQEVPCVEQTTNEFYRIDESVPLPKLDYEGTNLPLDDLSPEQQENYDALSAQLEQILSQTPTCPADGNLDGVVNQTDLDNWSDLAESWGLSSVYDLNLDGLTDEADEELIEGSLGACPGLGG